MSLSFSDSFETDHLVAVKLRPKAREDGAREQRNRNCFCVAVPPDGDGRRSFACQDRLGTRLAKQCTKGRRLLHTRVICCVVLSIPGVYCDHEQVTFMPDSGELKFDDAGLAKDCMSGNSDFRRVLGGARPTWQIAHWGRGNAPLDMQLTVTPQVRKRIFCAISISKRSFYQDRLGTKHRESTQKKSTVFSQWPHKSDVIVLKPLADTTTGCLDDTDCTEGQQCLALSCPAYRRCGINTTRGVLVRKTYFLRHLHIKTIILPRQARDKHRKNSKKRTFFSGRTDLLRHGMLQVRMGRPLYVSFSHTS
jgi:hypothetical protein